MRVLLSLAVLLMFACGGGEEAPTAPPDAPSAAPSAPTPATPPPTAAAPPPTAPAPAPAAADGPSPEMLASVPAGNLRGDAKRGGTLYQQYCASCHGAGGHGDGPVAASLNPKPANHTDPARMGALSDPWVYLVITKGGIAVGKSPLMAPWGAVLTEKDTKDVIAFVRGLSGT